MLPTNFKLLVGTAISLCFVLSMLATRTSIWGEYSGAQVWEQNSRLNLTGTPVTTEVMGVEVKLAKEPTSIQEQSKKWLQEPITHTPPPEVEERPNMGTIAINPDGTYDVFQPPAKGSKGFIHGESVLENLRLRLRDAVIEYGNLSSTKVYFDIDTVDTPGFGPFDQKYHLSCKTTREHACCFTGLRLIGIATNPCCQCSAPLPIHGNQIQSSIEKMISHVDPFSYDDKVSRAVWYGLNHGHWEYADVYSREFNLTNPYQRGEHPRKRIVSFQQDRRNKDLLDASFRKKEWNDVLQNKYIVTVSGNSYSGMLKPALLSNSCVLRQDTLAREWYEDKMTPWVHYIPVQYDMSDLFEKISWVKEHDLECRKIARQGRTFALENFAESAVNKYVHSTIGKNRPVE